jgi:hypothetical protein
MRCVALAVRCALTPDNLRRPQVGRLDLPPDRGGHTSFPILGVPVPEHGLIYLTDGADTGLHIVELTGAARAIAD